MKLIVWNNSPKAGRSILSFFEGLGRLTEGKETSFRVRFGKKMYER